MTPAEPDNYNDPAPGFPGAQHQSGDGSWNPYESTWTNTEPVSVQAQTVSALAILSLISGIISIPFICLCFLSIPFSLFAIVAGHISRGICRRSNGRVTGSGMAVAGFVLGYVSLAALLGMFAFFFAARSNAPFGVPGPPPPITTPQWTDEISSDEALKTAIETLDSMPSAGNSDAAVELATHLQASLHDIAQQMQVGNSPMEDGRTDASVIAEKGPAAESTSVIAELPETTQTSELQRALQESTVYCSLKSDSCAFLVGITNLPALNDNDRTTLSQMVWLAAGRSADGKLETGLRFAVAMIDDHELQEISLGTYQRSDQYDAGLVHRGPASDYEKLMQLELFFQPEPPSSETGSAVEDANDSMLEFPGE